jgi:signal transduction histidine kinase/CheY-like chemotaxis protein
VAVASRAGGKTFAVVIAGAEIGQSLTESLAELTDDDVVLLGDHVLGSSLPARTIPWGSLSDLKSSSVNPSSPPVMTTIAGVSYAALATPLNIGDTSVTAVLLISRDRALAPYRRIQLGLLAIGLLTALAGVLGNVLVTRRVTAPLKRLVDATQRVRKGDFDFNLNIQGENEIAALANSFNTMIEGLRERAQMEKFVEDLREQLRQSQKMEAVGRLAGGVAHDFNNLLTIIGGQSELLLRRVSEGVERNKLTDIKNASDRAAALTRQLLAFSRRQPLSPTVVSLNDIVLGLNSMLRRLIPENIELAFKPDPAAGKVKADRGQLEQVIINLAVNARDAMPDGGTLNIATATAVRRPRRSPGPDNAARPWAILRVSDTGIGMDAETKARIFEPFFTTKGPGKGTGLGLSMVYGIVEQSGGELVVTSERGQGATFEIFLPQVEGVPAEAPAPRRPAPAGGNETILLVEDEESVRLLIREVLESSGYVVLDAADAANAIQLLMEHAEPIQLLVTDMVMPGSGGRKLAEQALVIRPDLRVLFISGYTDDAIIGHSLLGPGMAFLQKPFTADALAAKVRALLDGKSAAATAH